MSGRKRITDRQVRIYMEARIEGKTQLVSAAKAGFSERTARRLAHNGHRPAQALRNWKTRSDPFAEVWEKELVPLLEAEPKLQARTLLEKLQAKYEDRFPNKLLRTLQRRVRRWKAVSGPRKEIIFRQNHPPGWQGISDFTDASKLGVSIRGDLFQHTLYHYRLPFSGWEYGQVILGGESFTALSEGLQNALWHAGGVPETHRTDSLSAAYKNLPNKAKEEFTKDYLELCLYYGTEPTRNNKGVSHENGAIESPHRHLKNRMDQALMLRGSKDFDSIDDYKAFVREVFASQNKRIAKEFAEELLALKPLPERRTTDYSEERVGVTTSSTIAVRDVTYSVPSRLIGMTLKVHLYDDRLECFVGGDCVVRLPRLRKTRGRKHFIDYHHVIHSLIRKPQAFRRYIYKDDLFPTFAFRQAWERLDSNLSNREACKEFVKILQNAARPEGEKVVNEYLEKCLREGVIPSSAAARALFTTQDIQVPKLRAQTDSLSAYDSLLNTSREVSV